MCRRYEYVIDNVLNILQATLTDETVDPKKLLAAAHPLGRFKESTMKAIAAFDNSPRGYEELYSTVLIDTPVGACSTRIRISMRHMRAACTGRVSRESVGTCAVAWGGVLFCCWFLFSCCEANRGLFVALQASTSSSFSKIKQRAWSLMEAQKFVASLKRCRTQH